METTFNRAPEIKGWGEDADPKKRPYYPIHKKAEHGTGAHWKRPPQQKMKVEILRSIERPNFTAVFGTACPPKGLSGVIRRFAFRYSENSFGHWMNLMLADRINFIEGLFEDLFKGKVPRVFGDGWAVDFKYDKKAFAWRTTRAALLMSLPVALYLYYKQKDEELF